MSPPPAAKPGLALVLDGGAARRMGGADKALLPLSGMDTLLDTLLRRLRPQCDRVAISANRDPDRFRDTGLPVLRDPVGPDCGPLAGVLAGLDHLALSDPAGWLLTVPGDTPLVPLDLVDRLVDAAHRGRHRCVRAVSGTRPHPLVALWSVTLRGPLRRALVEDGMRKVTAFQDARGTGDVVWPDEPYDPFLNANTPEDLLALQRVAAAWA